ncbi:cobalamin biosynthesis protein [Longispora sp. NPDC051575]|uniref:cobalamin biosynthesis protein n=1 Tax=Longispora sp. NPDC051575 TaxID=3154943 RepID=UPI0034292384
MRIGPGAGVPEGRAVPGVEALAVPAVQGARLVLGVGARAGVTVEELEAAVAAVLATAGLGKDSVDRLVTVAAKVTEPAVVSFARAAGWPLVGYPAEELAAVPVPHPSAVVDGSVGTPSVAEAAVLLSGATLLVPKTSTARITLAVGTLS